MIPTKNRIRFVSETLKSLASTIGLGRVGFRICPGITFNGMADADPAETCSTLLKAANALNLAYVHLIHVPLDGMDSVDLVRANWTGPIIENNNLTRDRAEGTVKLRLAGSPG